MGAGRFALALLAATGLFETANASFCVNTIEAIYTAEALVTDTSVHRTYVLCPRSLFEIGTLDFSYNLKGFQIQPPLPIRPNMKIKCGEEGRRDNMCWLALGDLHVDATPFRGITDETVDNVVIEGVTFIGSQRYSVWASKPGDLTFRDCEWKDHFKSVAPVLLDYFDDSTESKLTTTFDNCTFFNNRYFGWGSHSSLIYSSGSQNVVNIRASTFEDNDMTHNNTLAETNSFLVETLGPLNMERTCFYNNTVGVSNVVVFGNSLEQDRTYVRPDSFGGLCPFGAVFATVQQYDLFAPFCAQTDVDECFAEETHAPTMPPSKSPTSAPTLAPTTAPTAAPTGESTSPPTSAPTLSSSPTDAPTGAPTGSGSPKAAHLTYTIFLTLFFGVIGTLY